MEKHNTKFAVTLFNILDFDETSKVDSGLFVIQFLSLTFWFIDISLCVIQK